MTDELVYINKLVLTIRIIRLQLNEVAKGCVEWKKYMHELCEHEHLLYQYCTVQEG